MTETELRKFQAAYNQVQHHSATGLSRHQFLRALELLNIKILPLHLNFLECYFSWNHQSIESFEKFLVFLRAVKQLYRADYSGYSEDDINTAIFVFRSVDWDNDGRVLLSDVIDALEAMDPDLSTSDVEYAYNLLVSDPPNGIDVGEFLMILRQLFPNGGIPRHEVGRQPVQLPSYDQLRVRNSDITHDEHATFSTLFRLLDDDRDFHIARQEAESAFGLMGIVLNKVHFLYGWNKIDANHDGCIDFEEYLGMLRLAKQVFRLHQIGFADSDVTAILIAYSIADRDNDGLLQKKEYFQLCRALKHQGGDLLIDELFKRYDYNNMGHLDVAEFLMSLRSLFPDGQSPEKGVSMWLDLYENRQSDRSRNSPEITGSPPRRLQSAFFVTNSFEGRTGGKESICLMILVMCLLCFVAPRMRRHGAPRALGLP